MTSWHPDEPLEDTLYFFLRCSQFAEPEDPVGQAIECRAAVAILIGQSDEVAKRIRSAQAEPDTFVECFRASDPDD